VTTPADGRILVACIGNIFLGDDGFGVEMAHQLHLAPLPRQVTVIDYGICGFDLAYALIEPWRAVILVDAINRGGAPGDLYLLEVEPRAFEADAVDPHSMDPLRVFTLALSFGEITAPVYVLGCESAVVNDDFGGRMGLSEPVSAALPQAQSMVQRLIRDLLAQPAPEPASAHPITN
jgi:hydrogenase maturation protease